MLLLLGLVAVALLSVSIGYHVGYTHNEGSGNTGPFYTETLHRALMEYNNDLELMKKSLMNNRVDTYEDVKDTHKKLADIDKEISEIESLVKYDPRTVHHFSDVQHRLLKLKREWIYHETNCEED